MKISISINDLIKRSGIIAIALIGLASSGCKKSLTDGIVFSVGTSNFKYTAMVQVRDAANNNIVPGNLAVNVSGPNADRIYDLLTGKKALTVNPDGTVQMVISPGKPVTGPLTFNVSVTSPGYLPYAAPVTINPADSSQIIKVKLSTPASSAPAGGKVGVAQFKLVNGKLAQQTVIKIGNDNVLRTVATPALQTNKLRVNASADGSTPVDQVTYYDDGLTSIVLPQGTGFHYYDLVETGTMVTTTVQIPHTTVITTPISGVATGSFTTYQTYYTQETYTYPEKEWKKFTLSGSAASTDSIAAIVNYTSGNDITTIMTWGDDSGQGNIHTTISNQNVLKNELLFSTVVSKRMTGNPVFYKIHHSNKKTWYDIDPVTFKVTEHKDETVPDYIVYERVVSPDETAGWFTSMVIDPTAINPNTGIAVKNGDQIEIGIGANNSTVTQTVNQVANGQLRVQMLSYDAGFFYKAPNVASFDYTIRSSGGAGVTDPYNAECRISILGGVYGFYMVDNLASGSYRIQGKIASKFALNTTAMYQTYYWDKLMSTQNLGLTANFNPFTFAKPYPTITFNINAAEDKNQKEVITTSTPISGKNYAALTDIIYANTNYGNGYIYISNGIWKTNNLPIGANINSTSYINGNVLNFKYTVKSLEENVYFIAPRLW